MVRKVIVRKKYVAVRIPKDVYEDALRAQKKLEDTATELLGRPKRIPLTRVFRIKMSMPTTIPNEAIIKLIKRKRKNESY